MHHFLPFYPPNSLKNENSKKMKKQLEISSFYASVPKIMILCYTVPEIWRLTDIIIIFHFGLFFTLLTPTSPLTAQKMKTSQKWKKNPGGIIILHKCTKNHDHMLYCSWDMADDICNCYFLFWAIFCPFTALTGQKIKISKKWNKYLQISSFYTCVPKTMIRWCMAPEISCATDRWTDRWNRKSDT